MDDDIIRIMISTDNHLGYLERDPIRSNDSFASFEEVLFNAKNTKSDFVLLAGDMFHENKPSRNTLHSTMEIFRKYCFGGDPIYIEILNDQREIFKSSLGRVNYEDPYQSISLPVFSIHGNHDDPTREGLSVSSTGSSIVGSTQALAALDLLAVGNMINYFGKVDKVEDIEIAPILIKKDGTFLAIYGLGAIRDERLNRMWNQKKVKFIRLTEEQGRDDFFNIFVLHQNRDYGRGKKNCVHESMIPEWMDLVIWGNEHESQPYLAESLVGTYRILQPGSSVACSLSSGESLESPKHMAIIEIKQKKFRMKPILYKNIRPFLFESVDLKSYSNLNPNSPKVEEQIKLNLEIKIKDMIIKARELYKEEGDYVDFLFHLKEPEKVLIRLKIECEGFPAINPQRFGAQFIGEVANPFEIVLISKKKKESSRSIKSFQDEDENEDVDDIHKIKIENLVNETLKNSKNPLLLLSELELMTALDQFIVKKQSNSILDLVEESLQRTRKNLYSEKTIATKDSIVAASESFKTKIERMIAKGEPLTNLDKNSKDFKENKSFSLDEEPKPIGKLPKNKDNAKKDNFIQFDSDENDGSDIEKLSEESEQDSCLRSKNATSSKKSTKSQKNAMNSSQKKTRAKGKSKTSKKDFYGAQDMSSNRPKRAAASKSLKNYVKLINDSDEDNFSNEESRKSSEMSLDEHSIDVESISSEEEIPKKTQRKSIKKKKEKENQSLKKAANPISVNTKISTFVSEIPETIQSNLPVSQKKRQLPLSFSQSKSSAKISDLTAGWDD